MLFSDFSSLQKYRTLVHTALPILFPTLPRHRAVQLPLPQVPLQDPFLPAPKPSRRARLPHHSYGFSSSHPRKLPHEKSRYHGRRAVHAAPAVDQHHAVSESGQRFPIAEGIADMMLPEAVV